MPRELASETSDAALVLACYRLWGTSLAGRLLGDFAFAVWDEAASRLYCARDFSGNKPFYYAIRARRFVFASDICRVLALLGYRPPPNEGMVAEYLVGAFENTEETLYDGILRLAPGHQLTIENGRVRVAKSWGIDPAATIRYRREEDYLDRFIEIFRSAVGARLRCVGALGSTLSGGLDSSSVVGVAAALLRQEGAGRSFATYSMVFPGQYNDESPFIDAVAAKWGLVSHRFPWCGFPGTLDWLGQARESLDIPEYPTLAMAKPLIDAAAEHGVRVLLTGEGGDNWLTGSRYPFRDLFIHGKLRLAASELLFQARSGGCRYALASLLRSVLWAAAPAWLRVRVERARRPGGELGFLSRSALARSRLIDRLHCNDCGEKYASLPHWECYRAAAAGHVAHYSEIVDRSDAGSGIERWHPLLDRRIAEFAMAIPAYVHSSHGRGKLLLRGSTPSILPPLVGNRLDRGEFSIAFARALALPQVIETLGSPKAMVCEWLAPGVLSACLRRAKAGGACDPRGDEPGLFQCWMAFAVEAWWQGAYQAHP